MVDASEIASPARVDVADDIRRSIDTSVAEFDQTVVMVTHDPVAASYAERVVFLADGRIVDEMSAPTADKVLDRMKGLGD